MDTISTILMSAAVLLQLAAVIMLAVLMNRTRNGGKSALSGLREDVLLELRESRRETVMLTQSSVGALGDGLSSSQQLLQRTVSDALRGVDERFRHFSSQNEQQLSNLRTAVESRLDAIQADNGKRLAEIRATVDEKLQKTLEEKIGQSFRTVSERLEQVYRGLGEMQALAAGVGDLKRVLGNVKTRGTLGEIQLGAILEQLLAPNQYAAQCQVREGSSERVDYAVKMPAENGEFVYLPIDAKFPMDAYGALLEAYDAGEPEGVKAAMSALGGRLRLFAKEISAKYVNPPETTDFAVMFLPVEGLYAEVVRGGFTEQLQRDYKITVAGPTTMSALLNSLQMGFRTLAIQRRSGEVWKVLGAVKAEFDSFGDVLAATQNRLRQADAELDKLVGVRTKKIQLRLRDVEALPEKSEGGETAAPDSEAN